MNSKRITLCRLRTYVAALGLFGLTGWGSGAQAQNYPAHPIKIIIPFGPGGVTDLIARTYGKFMGDDLGQPFVAENKPGAGATIGAGFVAKAPPDGYTILLGTNVTHSVNPQLMRSIPYDALKDFEPIGIFGTNGNVLVVAPDFPANDFAGFIREVKQRKGNMSYASASIGSSGHLAAELLKQKLPGLEYTLVPYNQPSEANSAVMGGHVDFMITNIGGVTSLIKAGKLKAIAVTTPQRIPELKDVPTVAESGVPGFEVIGWLAAFAPKGTPPAIVERLNLALTRAQKNPELQKIFDAQAIATKAATPQQTKDFVRDEYAKWGTVITNGKIPKIN